MRLYAVIRASCIGGMLALGLLGAAESKGPLMGATREQVLAQKGEPKSNIVAGNREVLFFSTERVVLRDNRVIEVEEIFPEPSTPAPTPPPPRASEPSPLTRDDEKDAPTEADSSRDPEAPVGAVGQEKAKSPAMAVPPPPATRPPEVVIKSVRPPSHDEQRVGGAAVPKQAPTPITPAAPPSAVPVAKPAPATVRSSAPISSTPAVPGGVQRPEQKSPVAASTAEATQRTDVTKPASNTAAEPVSSSPAAAPKPGPGTLLWVGIGIAVGAIPLALWWRRRSTRSPGVTAALPASGAQRVTTRSAVRFSQELLSKLEWKRFEELVAAYYNKTGVVATRTKSGPDSAVHIRISWKGEPRPFACVHCIAAPEAPVDVNPITALCDALSTEDVRRGYVVTSGKFSPAARELADARHVTLLAGDSFVEKLNALPDPARAELMRDVTAGDFETPTCPRCETKMARSAADPAQWQCPQCATVVKNG